MGPATDMQSTSRTLPDMIPDENGDVPSQAVIILEEDYVKQLREEDYQSDDSTEMILNTRYLSAKTKNTGERKSKKRQKFLNNARSAVADPPAPSYTPAPDASTDDTWSETGLKPGELSHESESLTLGELRAAILLHTLGTEIARV